MLALKVNSGFLNLSDNSSISLELNSPFFGVNYIPASLALTFNVPASDHNRKLLNVPEFISRIEKPRLIENVELYIEGILFRIGSMKYRGFNGKDYSYNFYTDSASVADFATQNIRSMDLGTLTCYPDRMSYEAAKREYCLAPVYNPNLFTAEEDATYKGFQNYHDQRWFLEGDGQAFTPFVFLKYSLEKAFSLIGYTLKGNVLDDFTFQRTVFYSNNTLGKYIGEFEIAKQLPSVTLAQLMISVQNYFGCGFFFDTVRKEVHLEWLNDILSSQYRIDFTYKLLKSISESDKEFNGFKLQMSVDNEDKEIENYPLDWEYIKVGKGKIEVITNASPVLSTTTEDPNDVAKTWEVPHVKYQDFSSSKKYANIRFMTFNGRNIDNNENFYPQLKSGQSWIELLDNHSPWLNMLENTRAYERYFYFNIEDLINFDFRNKIFLNDKEYGVAMYMPVKLSATISKKEGLKPVKMELYKI